MHLFSHLFLMVISLGLFVASVETFAGDCPSSIYYPTGHMFKSGNYLYAPNGRMLGGGGSGFVYHTSGRILRTGTYFYHHNGRIAQAGGVRYNESGGLLSSVAPTMEVRILTGETEVGSAEIDRSSNVILKMEGIHKVVTIDIEGNLSCN